ncbi:GbsR/MarR family transcriptional regulator [Halalkalibacillus sediminis]|uniref:HTH-type transcriptional regulator n=1 Tax=Halalkalibacillus sediminis TaxID=2018042 RepID=A0A2I0QQS0_9BACI|nr:GbsR/MarR family transcriptional regulator [Halalkalibacillus sediminis]PKR76658.1 GbsR/MarR family transcriptional regulator [Halalkalibacillus sediminis]
MSESTSQSRQKIEDAKEQVIGALAETMDLYGVTPSAGNLYATMYFKDQMTLDEMRDELEMSKPSMSTSVRKLQELEMVKKTFTRGSRKHTYIAEKDFFRFFIVFYSQMWEREAKMNLEAIDRAQGELIDVIKDSNSTPDVVADAKSVYDQLESSKPYYHWLEDLVANLRNGKIFDHFHVDNQE